MSLQQVLMKNTTRMSLNERFTRIRSKDAAELRQNQQIASRKNRRLAQQMERRPAVLAAINGGRSGQSSIRDRLTVPRGYNSRRRGRWSLNSTARAETPVPRRARSSSVVSVRGRRGRLGGGRRPSIRGRRAISPFVGKIVTRARSRSRSVSRPGLQSRLRTKSPFRSRSLTRYRSRSRSRVGRIDGISDRPVFRGSGRGRRGGSRLSRRDSFVRSSGRGRRGGFRNVRGRGHGRRGRSTSRVGRKSKESVSKEQLDKQLDQYKSSLDKQQDEYHMQTDDSWN